MKRWAIATILGIGIGVIYVLSPLSVWFGVALWALHRYATSGLDAGERRTIVTLLAVAVVIRVAAVAGLFLITNHAQEPFGIFFGDEAFYLRRSIWLRNVALGVPIHSADLIYAFDDSGWTSHLYVLAFLQTLVGPSPYGVHLAGIAMYLFASVLLWRTVRTTLGRAPAVLGLAVLLFLPSLFAWSISALKEPLYFLMTACSISWSITIVRDRRWAVRVAALLGVIASVAALQTIREQGGVLTGAGLIAGVAMAWLVSRPRVLVAFAVALPIVVGAALRTPAAQIRAYGYVKAAARQHWGHVETKGWVYTLLDPRFYKDSGVIEDMQFRDAGRFVVGAVERYVTVPWPWEVQSTAALAELPEQVIWYFLVALFPIGFVFSLRRDVVLTGLFAGVALVAAAAIAFLSGNVGTLVRLRVLAIPYLACLSMVGLCELLARAARAGRPPSEKAELIWP